MRLDVAVHLGAAWALLMGLSPSFIAAPPPRFHVAHDSLPAVRDVDVLHRHPLFAARSVFSQGLDLGRKCSGELIEPGVVGLGLGNVLSGV